MNELVLAWRSSLCALDSHHFIITFYTVYLNTRSTDPFFAHNGVTEKKPSSYSIFLTHELSITKGIFPFQFWSDKPGVLCSNLVLWGEEGVKNRTNLITKPIFLRPGFEIGKITHWPWRRDPYALKETKKAELDDMFSL